MKKINLIIYILILLMPIALAQDFTDEVKNTFNPNNPLWVLDIALENLQLALTRLDIAKAKLMLKFTEERLQEIKIMVDADKPIYADLSINEFNKKSNMLINITDNLDDDFRDSVIIGLQKSLLRLEEIRQDAPVTARKGLENAIDAHKINIGRLDKRMSLTSKKEDVVSGY